MAESLNTIPFKYPIEITPAIVLCSKSVVFHSKSAQEKLENPSQIPGIIRASIISEIAAALP